MKALLVGDLHAKPSDLIDMEAFESLLYQTVEGHQPDRVVFLGDQYDTHGVVHVKVQRYYLTLFRNLVDMNVDVDALIGNHDMPGDRSSFAHAMQAHEDVINVVDWFDEKDDFLYVSYTGEANAIAKLLEKEDCFAKTLICHETFQGAQYENGFYAKDGIDAEKLPFDRIISGHIHKPGNLGKVWYPGSPRWLTVSDANIDRHIFVLDTDAGNCTPVPTGDVLSRIWHLCDTPESLCDEALARTKAQDRIVVDIMGPQSFIEDRRKALHRPGVRLRTFPTDQRAARVSEVDGIPAAFQKYVSAYEPRFGTPKARLVATINERVHV